MIDLLSQHWGRPERRTDLGSTQDRVYRLDYPDGSVTALKVSAADRTDEAVIAAEAAALDHVHAALPDLAVPLLLPDQDGQILHHHGDTVARMTSWIEGQPLLRAPHWNRASLCALGAAAGQLAWALGDFTHPDVRNHVEWDPRQANSVMDGLLHTISDKSARHLFGTARGRLDTLLPAAEAAGLPEQAVHLDLTDRNVLGRFTVDGTFTATGVVDFGDLVRTWRISELAAAVHAAVGRGLADPLAVARPVVEGFVTHCALTEVEADHLWTAILGRAAVCAVVETAEAQNLPDRDYVRDLSALDTAVLQAVLAVPQPLARSVLRESCGLPPWPVDIAVELRRAHPLPLTGPEKLTITTGWQELVAVPDTEADTDTPMAMSLGVRFTTSPATALIAPLDATVEAVPAHALTLRLDLAGASVFIHLDGVAAAARPGDRLRRGQPIAHVIDGHVGVYVRATTELGDRGRVSDKVAWTALCPDPGILLDITQPAPGRGPGLDTELDRRHRHVAAAQKLYYRRPPQMVRGSGQYLYDHTGRRYLDMVNNVAVVGHSHPRITSAASDQLALLSTNSRFLYSAIADYAERIAGTLPPALDRIFFVNSGSEAMELALQLARRYTARRNVVALQGAYHGWTSEAFELCTMPGDRPDWQAELAARVQVADCPDPYRGRHGGRPEPYLRSLTMACDRAADAGGLAAFVHEPIMGSLGGVLPPPGYVPGAYDIVRGRGGVCIADEVQVGYARTGKTFWAFQSQDAVPDIVATAKAAGNGHPVGFVACRHEIAEAFAAGSSFFSTPAGNPVSCRIGSAVLDIIADEGLQRNAAEIGAHLSTQLAILAGRHAEIGAVYGCGLYQGIDLVVGDGTSTPLPDADVAAICERLLQLGCVVQPTGLHGNVLKVKPPLCVGVSDADRFLSALDQVLRERREFRELSQ
jgi:4-aminobutyrate aminotransferase-like enzyme/Ser/Thr protein kinase RdoA (MazF antagonist)